MMKRLSLFVALACLGLALPMYADDDAVEAGQVTATWTAPDAPNRPTLPSATLESGSSYYLYNIEAGQFINEGTPATSGGWGSEACFSSTGVLATITWTEEADDSWGEQNVPGYVITTTYGTLFFNESFMYMDGSSTSTGNNEAEHWGERFFLFEQQADGSYTIQNTARTTNTQLTDEKDYVGYDATSSDNNAISDVLKATDTGIYWLLVTSDKLDDLSSELATYQTSYATWLEACQALVDMRVYLNNALTDALALGLQDDDAFTEGVTVYEDADATQDDIDEATAALAEAIQAAGTASNEVFEYDGKTYRKTGANLIANPDFSYGIACWKHETKEDADGNDCSSTNLTDRILKAIDWSNFSVSADDDYGYILSALTGGGTGSDGCLVTAWEIDPSKTYYFSCYTKDVSNYTAPNAEPTDNSGNATLDINTYANSQGNNSEALKLANDNGTWTQQTLVFNVGDKSYSNNFTPTISYEDAENLYALIRCAWLATDPAASFASFELCEVEELTVEEEDETSVIINPQFTTTDTSDASTFGWKTGEGYFSGSTGTGFAMQTSGPFSNSTTGANLTSPFAEAYGGWATGTSDYTLTQTISLPAGEYRLSADIMATQQPDAVDPVSGVLLFAGDATTSAHTANEVPETFSVDFAVEVAEGDETADVEIGLKLVDTDANWIAVDNFTLTYLGDVETNELLALRDLIAEANDIYDESKEGAENLQAAIDAAQAVLDDVDSDAEALESAMSALKDAMLLYQLQNGEAELLGAWVGVSGTYNSMIGECYGTSDTSVETTGTLAEGTVLTQTITDLPVGTYEVVIYCSANFANQIEDDGTPKTPAGAEEGAEVVTIAANGVELAGMLELNSASNEYKPEYVISTLGDVTEITLTNVIVAEDGTLSLSVTVDVAGAVNWLLVGTKSVTYVGEAPTYEDLVAALEEAEPLVANVGDEAFQIPTEDAEALQAAIEAAEELTEESSLSEIAAALTALTSAATAFEDGFDSFVLNEPEDGQVFNIIMKSTGNNVIGNALEFLYDATKTEGSYDLQFATEPNANLADQVFTFNPVTDASAAVNSYTVSFDDADGNTYYICAADKYSTSTNSYGLRATDGTNTDEDDALVIVVKATTTEGVWNLLATNVDTKLGLTTNDGVSLYLTNEYNDLGLAEASSTIEWTLEAEYGTLVLPFVPDEEEIDGLTFYSTEEYASGDSLSLVEVETLAANTPYIVSAEETGTYTFAVTTGVYRTYDSTNGITYTVPTAGWLTGAYASTEVPTDSYVLQNGDEGLAFYTVTDSDPITLTPNHCYLTVSSTSDDETTDEGNADDTTNAPAVIFFPNGNGTPTAITGVEANVADAEAVYDLSGRKVSQAQKGIYIKGGKKVVIK